MEGDGALNNATKKLFADTMSVTQELIMREAYSVFVLNYVYLIKKTTGVLHLYTLRKLKRLAENTRQKVKD